MKTNGDIAKTRLRIILAAAVAIGFLLAPVSALSARPDVPPGKASSTPVYDYRDFAGSGVENRVYDGTDSGSSFTIVDNISRLATGELVIDRQYWSEGSLQGRNVMQFRPNETELLWDWSESYGPGDTLELVNHFDPALSIRQAEMPKGAMQGGAAVNTGTPADMVSNVVRVNVALGLDDIDVPMGTLNGCLKMFEEHNNVSRISWYCPDIGLAKRLWGGSNKRVWELRCVDCPTP